MPNHVENHIEFNGDKQQIDAMLNKIGSDKYGTGTIDFKKIISMPETLNIEAGSRTDHDPRRVLINQRTVIATVPPKDGAASGGKRIAAAQRILDESAEPEILKCAYLNAAGR